jgi:PKD repeat protein
MDRFYYAKLDNEGFIHIVYASDITGVRESYYMKIDTRGNIVIPSQLITPDDGYPSIPTGLAVVDDRIYITTKEFKDGNWEAYFIASMPPQVPPVADANGPYKGYEGSAITFDASGSYDPDGRIVSYDWDLDGDGQYDDASGVRVTFTWGDDYSGTIGLKVTDNDGLTDTDSTTVSVVNVAPKVDAGPDLTVNEGSLITFKGKVYDPGWLDTHTYKWDFGDGTVVWNTLTPTHAYGDNGVYTVTLTVWDDDGDIGMDTLTITVYNVPPTVSIDLIEQPNPFFILPYEELTFYGSFSDPGWLDTHTAVWDFGDGVVAAGTLTEENNPPDATGTIVDLHAYTAPGDYTVTLTVTDDDGGTGTATAIVHVATAEEAVDIIDSYIQALPGNAFDKNANQRKTALHGKLEAVQQQLTAGAYQGAINKLLNDLKPKLDGDPTPKDWIIDPTAQADLCMMIDALVAYLQTL